MKPAIYLFLIPAFLAFSLTCGREKKSGTPAHSRDKSATGADHARGFEIEEHEDYRILRVFDPWQGASNLTFEYILVDRDRELPEHLPRGTLVRTPVSSVICLSTTHIAMLDFISATGNIIAISASRYIYNKQIRQRISQGELPDIGYDMNLDYEKILQLRPDVILAYGVGAETASYTGRLQSLGINVILIGEYLEHSPLAQAEWVRFVAHLFNLQDLAKKRFMEVEEEYNRLKEMTGNVTSRPVVLTGLPWRDSWFVPGGNSQVVTLISDAGGRYLFDTNSGRENFPVSMETVFSKAVEVDYWINTGTARSMRDIEKTDPRLTGLRPFLKGSVYNNNARTGEAGGNDFWESGIVNPHLVLKDLINILHPDLMDSHQWVYYHKL